jgi:hypothetical protein
LGIILHGLRTAAVELAERTVRLAKKKEAEEKRADQHRRAEAQLRRLDEDLENWSKAEALQRFIAHVEHKLDRNRLSTLHMQTGGYSGQEWPLPTLIRRRRAWMSFSNDIEGWADLSPLTILSKL